jgi:methanogenic corrinoid protein MtbC1
VLRPDLLAAFHAAAIDESPAPLECFLRDLVRQKIGAATVADLYIPALARQLGEDWMEDRVSFLQVTLASSRMQAMLRALGAAWSADLADPGRATAFLLMVPRNEQHTLGSMVLLGQLRRVGVSVRLAIAPEPAELPGMLADRHYQGALISASSRTQLPEVRALVDAIRRSARVGMVIAVGGQILQGGGDVALATGADLATCDAAEVLAACDGRVVRPVDRQSA